MRKTRPFEDRFFEKVSKSPGCWLWKGALNSTGRYGVIWRNGKLHVAHRALWEHLYGPVPAGMDVCHFCDVRNCVNPSHLWLGTRQENLRDMMQKSRRIYKLSNAQVLAIRERHASGESMKSLAREYGVSDTNIKCIVSGQTFKWLTRI